MSRKMISDISLLKIHIVNFLEEPKLNLNKLFYEFLFTKENMHKIAEGKFLADIPFLNYQFVKVTADLSFKASPEVISKRSKLAGMSKT